MYVKYILNYISNILQRYQPYLLFTNLQEKKNESKGLYNDDEQSKTEKNTEENADE